MKWLDVRDILEGIITLSLKISTLEVSDEHLGPVWIRIQENLNDMVDSGRKLATSKAMRWVDIEKHLAHRAENADLLGKLD